MRKLLFLLLLTAGSTFFARAQRHLAGLWEGTLTYGGLEAQNEYRFELFIDLEGGKRIKGRSYIHLAPNQIIEMDVLGYIYEDRSISLQDIRFIPAEGSELLPPFNRKYQMIFSRSIWETTLQGYWQEVIDSPFDGRRDRGKIFLKKKDASRA